MEHFGSNKGGILSEFEIKLTIIDRHPPEIPKIIEEIREVHEKSPIHQNPVFQNGRCSKETIKIDHSSYFRKVDN